MIEQYHHHRVGPALGPMPTQEERWRGGRRRRRRRRSIQEGGGVG